MGVTASNVSWRAWRDDGDPGAFEALVRPELAHALAVAVRAGCDDGEAHDVVQDCLVKLVEGRAQLPRTPGLRPWLVRAVRTRARSHRRTEARRRARERVAARPESGPPATGALEVREQLDAVLQSLEESDREALLLRYVHDLDYAEVAYVLGVSEGAARLRVHRSLRSLRARLGCDATAAFALIALPRWGSAEQVVQAALAAAPAPTVSTAVGGALAMGTLGKAGVATVALTIAAVVGWSVGRDAPAPVAADVPGDAVERLEQRVRDREAALLTARRRVRELERQRDAATADVRPTVSTPTSGAVEQTPVEDAPVAKSSHQPLADGGVPAAASSAAADLSVSRPALEAAYAAYLAVSGKRPAAEGERPVQHFESFGTEGFRALVALIRGGLEGTYFQELADATWAAGQEKYMIEAAEDEEVSAWGRWTLLQCLGGADSGAARDYLAARLAREDDDGLFMCTAQSLGRLGESRGIDRCAASLRFKKWSVPLRRNIVGAMAGMDGRRARTLFVEHLEDAETDLLEPVVRALVQLDPEEGARQAARLLDDARFAALSAQDQGAIKRLAGRD
jgi:RNA polymerase sigma-70 factor, ECF subfamily